MTRVGGGWLAPGCRGTGGDCHDQMISALFGWAALLRHYGCPA